MMKDALEIITAALSRSRRPCITSSFQADCVALLHMMSPVAPDIPVLFLDTVHHFPETLAYQAELTRQWDLNLVTVRSANPEPGLWRLSTDACCKRHKVDPLFAALEPYDVWFTALRREQSASRAHLQVVDAFGLPSGRTIQKVSPLALWSDTEVLEYAEAHQIPLLPLYDRGYTSIGCEPCTALPASGGSSRSGRWQGRKLECGIHVQAPLAREGE